jgi:hypothetical protein
MVDEMKLVGVRISRRNRGDQFWSKLDTISKYNTQSTSYQAFKGEIAFCYCKATGHSYQVDMKEWNDYDLEHRIAFSEDRTECGEIVIDRKTGEVISEQGDVSVIEAIKKGVPTPKWQIGIWEANDYQ